ncbi:MAG: transposase [Candidatus Aphodosoma sp.]
MCTKLHTKSYNNKRLFLTVNPSDDIAENDPVRIVDAIVENLDLKEFKKLYREKGRCPYHPKMMLKIILYAYMNNIYSCRKIEKVVQRDIHYIWLAAQERPDFVTINRFHLEQRPRYKPNLFHHDNFHNNAAEDYYVCPMGQHMTRIGTSHSKTASGYRSENARYRAQNCNGCPLRCLCYKAKGDRRTIEVNHRLNEYKRKARELLTSEEGLKHRGRRCIEPEAVFGQMKFNMAYRRFRHFGKEKVTMDFAFFAIAFNIKKMYSKIAKQTKNGGNTPHFGPFLHICGFLPPENRIFWKNQEKSAA